MADDKQIEGSSLSAIVASELRQARSYDQSELSGKRALAIEYMRGEMPDTPPRPNGSRQTSRDFADTVGWILPGVIRVFTASDHMVQYDKVEAENDDWSHEATEYTNYTFFRESDGYRILYNATYDSLTLGNGLVSTYWDPPRQTTRWFKDKTENEIAALITPVAQGGEGWQPTGIAKPGKDATDLQPDPMTGELVEVLAPTISAKLMHEDRPGRLVDMTCKPENLFLANNATEIDRSRFVAYLHDDKTRSDLMEMADDYGWDKEIIKSLPKATHVTSGVNNARFGDIALDSNSPFASGDPVDLHRCFVRADMDADGVAELIEAWFAGSTGAGELLGWEEWEGDIPYTDIPCYPVPHRYDAQSVFDRTHDIQRVKTTLIRGVLDNSYAVGLPMLEVDRGSVENPDILISPKFGGTIWKKPGSAPIVPHVTPFITDKLLLGLQYMDEMTAKRTGVSRSTMALDPEALQNQTATANQNQRDAGYSQIELIARNMAELGWARYFAKRLKMAIKHEQVRAIPSKEEETGFREVDPSKWDANMAVSINVGLGTGSRDRDMSMLNQIYQMQATMAQMLAGYGLKEKAIEFIPKILKSAEKIAESSGLNNPDEYFPKFDDQDMEQAKQAAQQPPPPDPKLEMEKAKMQLSVEAEKAKAQANVIKEQAQMEADLATTEQGQQFEREKFNAEIRFKMMELAQQREIELLKLGMTDREAADGSGAKPVDATASVLMDGMNRLGDAIVMMSAHMSAPTEIVRDPATGKAIGARKVVN